MVFIRRSNPQAALPKARLETLVDGVAAIVMTLLILEVKVPSAAVDELPHALLEIVPELLAFAVSVLAVGAFWLGHNHQMNFIRSVDRGLVWINVTGLGIVAILPLSTALLGHYWSTLALALYGANLAALGIVALVHWGWATRRRHLVREDLPVDVVVDVRNRTMLGTALAIIGATVAFASPGGAVALYAAAFVPFVLPGKYDDHLTAGH